MAWPTNPRPAKSLLVLRDQVDARWPVRDKSNDGMLGDARHAATKSDHNPDINGVVLAMDVTKDLAHNLDSRAVAQALLDSRDPRIKYCLPAGTRLLCADLNWRPIEALAIGDPLVAFDEYGPEKTWHKSRPKNVRLCGQKMRTGFVESIETIDRPCYEIVTDRGTYVASSDHLWLASTEHDGKYRSWLVTQNLKPGTALQFFATPWKAETSFDAGWLAGIFDGEGCLSRPKGAGWMLSIAQKEGAVLDRVLSLLTHFGIRYGLYDSSGAKTVHIRGGLPEVLHCLGAIPTVRLRQKAVAERIWEGTNLFGTLPIAVVQEVRSLGQQKVIALQSSTMTFIANGLFSHNCISNGQICSSKVSPWVWRPYSGADDHSHHFHLSVDADPALYDDVRPWKFAALSSVPIIPSPVPGRFTNIIATEFGGTPGDPETSAYDDHLITATELGVALPARIIGPRRDVRVIKGNKSVVCPILDIGPWNTHDPYWVLGARPQSETGTDLTGRKTNRAGIDLTPAVMDALGVPGPVGTRSTVVDWEFVTTAQPVPIPAPPPPMSPMPPKEPSMDLFKFLPLLMRILDILPKIQTAAKAGTNIFTLLQTFAPDLVSILTGVGSTLFPTLPPDSQAKAGSIMLDPTKVVWIQNAINTLGLANPPLVVDGSYGAMTKAAVIAFQTAHSVTPADGWAGDVTEAALRVELTKKAAAAPPAPVVSLTVPSV